MINSLPLPLKIQFTQEGGTLLAKPFPSYPTFMPVYEGLDPTDVTDQLSGLVAQDAALLDAIIAVGADAAAAQSTADTAVSNAAVAQDTANDAAAAAAAAQSTADTANLLTFPTFSFFGDELWFTAGTPTRTITASYPYNWVTSCATDNSVANFANIMDSGTWEIHILTGKGATFGKLNIFLEGNPIVSLLDLYQSGSNFAYEHILTGVVLTGDKNRVWTMGVQGKNASSSGYNLLINKIWGHRTA